MLARRSCLGGTGVLVHIAILRVVPDPGTPLLELDLPFPAKLLLASRHRADEINAAALLLSPTRPDQMPMFPPSGFKSLIFTTEPGCPGLPGGV